MQQKYNELTKEQLIQIKDLLEDFIYIEYDLEELNYIFNDGKVFAYVAEECPFDLTSYIIKPIMFNADPEHFDNILTNIHPNYYLEITKDITNYDKNLFTVTNDTYQDVKLNIPHYLITNIDNINKPISYYQENYLPQEIEFKYQTMTSKQYAEFIRNNYTVNGKLLCHYDFYFTEILGLYYASKIPDLESISNYFVGYTNNPSGGKTILGVFTYSLNSLNNLETTYVQTVETNMFYRGRGILKEMVKAFNNVQLNNPIIITDESDMGQKAGVHNIFRSLMENMEVIDESTYHKTLLQKRI